ncbi:hypothetical protein PLESTB_001245500 [Pleodorina starrii]|uniref:Uncharacterized protein n=1 Tax=Pleodorina starrii TaxID=330485 RepID=A0A9W6BTR5_9CHLO|nr:hypothetical protein PLESTM_000214300 [Pleodorina starrii]GLC57607.1 hypothetical protein PLESTB_001245500 [Pleodorina starrii]GLC63277.1 hypothetical protein PLESTF_000019300 [Pleodorina starrii]
MSSTSGRSDVEDLDYITPEDIAIFRRTLLARRFPGLQKLSEAELIALIRAERRATGRKLVLEAKTHPKTTFTPPPPKREQPAPHITPFVPANPFEAKTQSARANTERFIGVNTPYEAHRADFNEGRTTDESRSVAPFVPSCSSRAKDTLQIKYFLNSPMHTTVPLGQAQPQQQQMQLGSRNSSFGPGTKDSASGS